jgi:hypothetical protein
MIYIKNYIKALVILAFISLPHFAAKSPSNLDPLFLASLSSIKELEYISKKDLLSYIAYKESSNRYNVSNQLNMLGKYQASRSALLDFGYSSEIIDSIHATIYADTLSSGKLVYYFDSSLFPPTEQERFINWYIYKIERVYLKDIIEQYVGQQVDGVYITRAGIIFASMLGFRHVQIYLESQGQSNFNDANGTTIKNRLLAFDAVELAG